MQLGYTMANQNTEVSEMQPSRRGCRSLPPWFCKVPVPWQVLECFTGRVDVYVQ